MTSMKLWQQQPLVVKLSAVVLVLICVIDFTQRVWLSAETTERSTTEFDAAANVLPEPQVDPAVLAYIEQLQTATAADTENTNVADNTPKAPLIEGGVNLGEMRVRVRAVYTSSVTGQQVALIEAQHLTERSLELTEVNLGYALNNYKVSNITANGVEFTAQDANESITIPVFDY